MLVNRGGKVRHPALILITTLKRTVDATHSEDHSRQAETVVVVENVLLRAAFGASIWTVKIQCSSFAYTSLMQFSIRWDISQPPLIELHIGHSTIDFVS